MGEPVASTRTNMKYHLVFLVTLYTIATVHGQRSRTVINTKAPSDYQNCDCQCNSDTWTDGYQVRGNCKSADRTGARFCYISGRALNSCRDVKRSSFLEDSYGRRKYYSYEACSTPPRWQCSNFGYGGNYGDGDFNQGGGHGHGHGHGHGGSYGGSNWSSWGSWSGNNYNGRPSRPSRPNLGNLLGGSGYAPRKGSSSVRA